MTTDATPLHPALVATLRAQRDRLNADFALARHRYPNLDGEHFAGFLRTSLNAVVAAVAGLAPDRAADVATEAYALGLDLVGQRLAGPGATLPWIDRAWQELAGPWAAALARAPQRLLAAVSNALCQLAQKPGAEPAAWIGWLAELGAGGTDADALLALGQVAAWRAGLAQYRSSALDVAATLDQRWLRALFALPAHTAPATALAAMRSDPWWTPEPAAPGLRFARRVGAFRGLGGSFLQPPRVVTAGERLVVTSAGEHWELVADRFGWAMWRTEPPARDAPASAGGAPPLPPSWRITASDIARGGDAIDLGQLGGITSVAATTTTLAVTTSLTHAVGLIALGRPAT